MKFAHLADCHLGGWRQPELRELNFRSFQEALQRCIKEKVEFILIAGDLFDSAYPPIDTLKFAFEEFRKLKERNIPVFLIAGSHDYSISGKTFLDVLEKAGFCTNVAVYEEKDDRIVLLPTIHKNVALYGYPGKKSSYEVEEIERMTIQNSPGLFRVLMLHTAIKGAVGETPIKAVNEKYLPEVDYIALGHLHIKYVKNKIAYSGPIFPNTLSELEELKGGSFIIFDNGKIRREEIFLKNVFSINLEIKNALLATESILASAKEENLEDKIIIIRLFGELEKGKISDIDFKKIETEFKNRGAFIVLKSTSKLNFVRGETEIQQISTANIEEDTIRRFKEKNQSEYNSLIVPLINILQLEKTEEEILSSFEERLLEEIKNIINI